MFLNLRSLSTIFLQYFERAILENHRISWVGIDSLELCPNPAFTWNHTKIRLYVWEHCSKTPWTLAACGACSVPTTLRWRVFSWPSNWPSPDAALCHSFRSCLCHQTEETNTAPLLPLWGAAATMRLSLSSSALGWTNWKAAASTHVPCHLDHSPSSLSSFGCSLIALRCSYTVVLKPAHSAWDEAAPGQSRVGQFLHNRAASVEEACFSNTKFLMYILVCCLISTCWHPEQMYRNEWWGLFCSISFYILMEEHLYLAYELTQWSPTCGSAVWEFSFKLIFV